MLHLVCMAALVTGIVKMVLFRDCKAGFRTSTMYAVECTVELSASMLQCGEARLSGKDKYRGKHRDPDRPHPICLFSPQFLPVLLIQLACYCSK
jgi:hypothetical protein